MSNIINKEYMEEAELAIEELEMQSESMEEVHGKKSEIIDSHKNNIETVISFNRGGSWHRLKAPFRDVEGRKFDCEGECYLNLHGLSSDFPPFYSVESAAGLIIGNGNVGASLVHDADETGVFLSRDGGLNWAEIMKGPHIYELGDHGGLIVVGDVHKPTSIIKYSWDEGSNWQEHTISDDKINIENIVTEPNGISQQFLVYGTINKKGTKKGVVIRIDFSNLHEPQCKLPESPDSKESDYEKWSPTDGKEGHECLLGKKYVYIRRKKDAQCYNGLTYEKKVITSNCQCTEEDYECDTGYGRSSPGAPCTLLNGQKENQVHEPPAVCVGYYTISQGYRKIPGDTCEGGVQYEPYIIRCPYSGIYSSLGVIFLILIVFGGIVIGLLSFKNAFSESVSEYVNDKMRSNPNKKQYYNIVNI